MVLILLSSLYFTLHLHLVLLFTFYFLRWCLFYWAVHIINIMSQDNEQQQERRRLKNQTKAIYQATRRANPVTRSLEQSSDTARKRIAREEPGVREQRWEHEQPADTVRWAVAREEPVVREQRQEHEQPADTVRRAVAREEPGVQEQRREQEQPADTVRWSVAREEPGVREHEQLANTRQRADESVK